MPTSPSQTYEDFLTKKLVRRWQFRLGWIHRQMATFCKRQKDVCRVEFVPAIKLSGHTKKIPPEGGNTHIHGTDNSGWLCGFADSPRFYAVRADSNSLHAAVHDRPDPLQVWHKASRCPIVCMTHIVSCHRFLATDITNSCHHVLQLIRCK